MRSYKRTRLLFIVLITGASITAIAALRAQTQLQNSPSQENKKNFNQSEFESQFPVVDYETSEPTDPKRLAKKRSVGKKYDKAEIPISEKADTIVSVVHWAAGLPALPIAQSQAIVIGMITNAEANLSNDKTSVYSEFTIRIEETLKNETTASLVPNGEISASRGGGRVRFPSGHVVLQWSSGQGLPKVGQRYVLFLTRDQEQNFNILTGYELKADRVRLLDNPGGGTHPIAQHEGKEENSFLQELRANIVN